MNITASKVMLMVVATSVLTALYTGYLIKRMVPLSGSIVLQDRSMTGGQAGTTAQYGMTLARYASLNPKALADLETKVRERQSASETDHEITIDLKSYVNCQLTDPLADKPDEKDHTMAEFPKGRQIFGGVPFDVQGIIQLNGPSVQTGSKLWPLEVKDIAIGHPVKKLHLLHGAFNIVAPNAHVPFATLILHYADGSKEEMELEGGTHALRCVDGSVPQELSLLESPQTELGWFGSDSYLKKNNPNASLHVYRTTFDNPKPGATVTTVDYVSTMINPGPFLMGLTIE